MLDDFDKLRAADESGFLAKLHDLPGSYEGPDGLRDEPYGLIGFGEAAPLGRTLQSWVDAPLVVSGTQFMLASGFDYGELAPLRLSAEMAGAEVVVLGYSAHEPTLRVERGPLSVYTYMCYLAYATGHGEALAAAEQALESLRARVGPEVETAQNPAKTLAWALWNRVPLLIGNRNMAGLPELLQHVFARVGKTLAITVPEHPLAVLAGAFETRHQLGDDVVALLLGAEDDELRLAREVLETRVAQIETLEPEELASVPDAGSRALVLWYFALWVAAYLALLSGQNPQEGAVYDALRQASGSS